MTTVTAKQMHTQLGYVYNLVDQEGEVLIIKNSKPRYKIVRIEREGNDINDTAEKKHRTDERNKLIASLPPTDAPSDLSTTYKDYIYTL